VAEYVSGAVARRYAHGPGVDEPLIWYEGSGVASGQNWLIADRQGSIIATTNAAGTATTYSYGPYGEPHAWTGSRFRYTGQIMLPELRLYHYKARVYDPGLGRFLQTDPVGYNVDLNLYQYVFSDPLNLVDPSGLQSCEDVGASSCRSSVGGLAGALETIESAWNQFQDTAPQAIQGVIDDVQTTLENVDEVTRDTMNSPEGIALGIIFDPSPVGEARAVASGTTRLYRAVSEAEAAQIARTGVFEAGPNSLGGKWFAETIEHAREWGQRLGNPVILRVDLPTARANQLIRVERLDNIGPARYGELNQLEGAVIREVR